MNRQYSIFDAIDELSHKSMLIPVRLFLEFVDSIIEQVSFLKCLGHEVSCEVT
jgi:hypothetical protein